MTHTIRFVTVFLLLVGTGTTVRLAIAGDSNPALSAPGGVAPVESIPTPTPVQRDLANAPVVAVTITNNTAAIDLAKPSTAMAVVFSTTATGAISQTSSGNLSASSTATKTLNQTGSGNLTVSSTATGTLSQTGPSLLSISSTATGALVPAGSGNLSLSSTGTAALSQTGSGALSLSSTTTGVVSQAGGGNLSTSATAAGTTSGMLSMSTSAILSGTLVPSVTGALAGTIEIPMNASLNGMISSGGAASERARSASTVSGGTMPGSALSGSGSGTLTLTSTDASQRSDWNSISGTLSGTMSGALSEQTSGTFAMSVSGLLLADRSGTMSIATTSTLTGSNALQLSGTLTRGTLALITTSTTIDPATLTAEIEVTHQLLLQPRTHAIIATCLDDVRGPFLSTVVLTGTDGKPIPREVVSVEPSDDEKNIVLTTAATSATTVFVSYRHAAAPWAARYLITNDPNTKPERGIVEVWAALQNPTLYNWSGRVILRDRLQKNETHAIECSQVPGFSVVRTKATLKPEIKDMVNLRARKTIDEVQRIADAKAKLAKLKNLWNHWKDQAYTDVKPAILRDLSDQIEQIENEIAVHEEDRQQDQFEIDRILDAPSVLDAENPR